MAYVAGTDIGETLDAADGVTNGSDLIYGYGGNDTIRALGGDDGLIGGAGADILDGGSGIDIVYYFDSLSYVIVNLADGTGAGGTAAGDTLISIENAVGSDFDDFLFGSIGSNNLYGQGGDDFLSGGGGNDELYGGIGDDTLKGGGGADFVSGSSGIDTVSYYESALGVDVSLQSNQGHFGDAEGDTFSGIEDLTGSLHDDHLFGNNADNVISGLDGSDELRGFGGNDTLYGGAGNDYLYDSEGNDTLYGGDGNDALKSGIGNDTLYGGNGNDTLNGLEGLDTMVGGFGNDTYYINYDNDVIVEAVGQGTDKVRATVTYVLPGGAEIELFEAGVPFDTAAFDLVGNEFGQSITGNDGQNTIVGGLGLDVMTGLGGGDVFVWTATAESGVAGADADVITDFNRAVGDLIAVNPIDADGDASNGDTAFTFVAGDGATFTGAAQITYFTTVTDTYILFNTNADMFQEMTIRVVGVHAVDASWFVL